MIGVLLKIGSKDLFAQKELFLKTPYILNKIKKIVRYISEYTFAQLGKVTQWNSASTRELRVPSFNPSYAFGRPLEANLVTRLPEIFRFE